MILPSRVIQIIGRPTVPRLVGEVDEEVKTIVNFYTIESDRTETKVNKNSCAAGPRKEIRQSVSKLGRVVTMKTMMTDRKMSNGAEGYKRL